MTYQSSSRGAHLIDQCFSLDLHQDRKSRKIKRRRKWRWPWDKDDVQRDERVIALNDLSGQQNSDLCSNYISTSEYNAASFVPKFLFGESRSIRQRLDSHIPTELFSKYANLFFLFTVCIQQVLTSQYTTIVPLGVILLASVFKEVRKI